MIATGHWSATTPVRLRKYHIELPMIGTPPPELSLNRMPNGNEWAQLRNAFVIFKNFDLGVPTDYGTWDQNRDPRDGSSNIEIAAMCMAGATTTRWGRYPFTVAHAWMMAGVMARVCILKNIDTAGSFAASVEPSVLQNGPIYNVSTHAERALQTVNWGVPGGAASSQDASLEYGYFIFSGDPDSRFDLAALQEKDADKLADGPTAKASAIESAAWLRTQAHALKAAGISDMWGLDAPASV